MDCKQDWQHNFKPTVQDFDVQNANLLYHSDGGTRGDTCSAAAWILEASVVKDNVRYTFPVVAGGTYLPEAVSSFLAESLALHDAIYHLSESVS